MIPPRIFIELAEDSDIIRNLDWIVLEKTIRHISQNERLAQSSLSASVNMSCKSFIDLDCANDIAELLSKYKVEAERLTIEITESNSISDLVKLLDILIRLRMKGISLAIDDFGIGYSSLKKLVDLPFNQIKIDKSFVINFQSDPECSAIVKNLLSLALEIDVITIAEGIENEGTLEAIEALGCTRCQGFLFSHPIPVESFVNLVAGPVP